MADTEWLDWAVGAVLRIAQVPTRSGSQTEMRSLLADESENVRRMLIASRED